MGKTQLRLAAVLAFAGLAACSARDVGPAKYGANLCRHVSLLDDVTLKPIRGAEDLALDQANGRLFVSAYDRRAVEKAARSRKQTPPSGGVYAISLETLFDPDTEELYVGSLAAPGEFAGGLRPHGIHYDAANHELIFINRTYAREGSNWRMTPKLQRIGANGEAFVGVPQDSPCAANDVTVVDGGVLTTFDHASCGIGGGLEDIFRLKRSGFTDENGAVFNKAAFANGIASLPTGDIVLAATRENMLLVMDKDSHAPTQRIELPGGPDNISVSWNGTIIAAVHPKMMKLALNRKLGWGRAPSRIVKANPETGMIDILFNDSEGELFSAATAAIETPQGLVAGSVTDEGLLVCRAPA